MPEICRFFGIVISMNYNDHDPPHFHVKYSDQKAIILLESLTIERGSLSPRVMGMVLEWAMKHEHELLKNWHLARDHRPLIKIKPLE